MLLLLAVVIGLSGCSSATGVGHPSSSARSGPAVGLTVFAAASLTGVFDDIGHAFMTEHPGVTVHAVYDGSSTLVTQLVEGAPADVFATADEATMQRAVKAGLIDGAPSLFATNTLEIAVAPGNPAGIRGLADLAKPGLAVVVCAVQVPCGAASADLLTRAGVELTPASEEQNVKAVVTKVSLGEADAGIVYATDVQASEGRIEGVDIGADVHNRYLIGKLKAAGSPEAASAFVGFVLSDAGRQLLSDAGFRVR